MSDTPNIDIRPDHWQIVRDILHKHVPHYEVWAFGSRAKWLAKQYSDLDLAIITDQPLSLAVSAALADDFSESDLPWKVDIVDWAATSEAFRQIIERDRVVVQKSRSGPGMVSEWRDTTWGEEISLEYGKAIRGYDEVRGKYRVFGSNGAIGWTENALAEGPGVILGRKGAYRGVRFWREPFWVIDTAYYVVPKKKLDMRWLYYAIKHHKLGEIDDGSPIPSTTRAAVYVRELTVPSLKEQGEISYVLGVLDDKIELNRRMNQTLEAMVHALFKSWFVDFDGVSLDDMQESELGLIPKGWRAASLDSIAHYLNGLALQKFPPESEAEFLPVIKIAQLRAGHAKNADKASTRLKSEYIVQDGDVLFSWSGTLEVDVWTGGRGALNQHLFKVTSTEVPKWFYYFATRQHLPDFRTIAAGKATTMGHIQRKHLADAKVAVPPTDAMGEFDRTIAPLFEQIINNALQSRTLAQQREILLPKLISGEFRVRDVKCFLEKAK
ncbi:restriction endonuclease subunit S [Xanthomonas arboricola pv. juglandis]|uniref:Restriction endonuclease subunit S n=3 Tax=Xanthomonas arboricola TaxID=56448 RepID=A0ABM8SN89_9XANT|nr:MULTISPECIES: restriction endonuclease subunit S [Xanthomonas]MDN0222654.1 restriction endonuclease subunit S [Xanthomonas arboricola pv. juglandis]MDN0226912.1 restriction endonuclease subunit S [Xanthomonas arboricola pv. juglandis]MDN0231171.1 restriction endonuclease subunit S [Xanthomonas arboricola pv. juglandis]MDN0235434.1 restriction endonuclease subunit S [Xanthomonas arboricola pv. juglandis]MDN0239672.1 restriction endonuclease subunit S [Xanthomonas arboricola pv. juglandis]